MYILYINELPEIVKNKETCANVAHEAHSELFGINCENCREIPCYADDATLVVSSATRIENQEKIVMNLKKISDFLTANELVINEDKTMITEVMIRQKRVIIDGDPPWLEVKDKEDNLKFLTAGCHTRLLGGNIGQNLGWMEHLETGYKPILPKLRRQLGALNKLAKQTPPASHLVLANGMFMSNVCYLLPIWGATTKTMKKKVQVLMNKAAHYVTGWDKKTRTVKLMDECRWLLIDELIIYQSIISMWTVINRKIPRQLADEISVENDGKLTVDKPRLKTIALGFKWRTVESWNKLEEETRKEKSLPKFKKLVKTWIKLQRAAEPD